MLDASFADEIVNQYEVQYISVHNPTTPEDNEFLNMLRTVSRISAEVYVIAENIKNNEHG